MRKHSLLLSAEGTSPLQSSCRTLLLSNFLHVEPHIQGTCLRTTRHSYLYPGLLEDRVGGLLKGAAEPSLVSGNHQKGSPTNQFLPVEPAVVLSSVSWLPKVVSYRLRASTFLLAWIKALCDVCKSIRANMVFALPMQDCSWLVCFPDAKAFNSVLIRMLLQSIFITSSVYCHYSVYQWHCLCIQVLVYQAAVTRWHAGLKQVLPSQSLLTDAAALTSQVLWL